MVDKNGRFEKGDTSWKKGTKKIQDLNEIRKCKDCELEKIVTEFVQGKGGLYRYKCKACRQKERRTGKISETRFKPGHEKGLRFEEGHMPWYKVKGVDNPNKGNVDKERTTRFSSYLYKEWKRQVLEIYGKKCADCGSTNRLAIHHIKPWNADENLRFDVNNGKPLCNSCHGKLEGFKKGRVPHNKRCLQDFEKK